MRLKRRRLNPEHHQCKLFIQEIDYRNKLDKRLNNIFVYHITNEGTENKIRGILLRLLGLRAGVSDYFVMRASKGWNGLYIEMKAGKNKLTDKQIEFTKKAELEGYKVVTAYSAKEAIETIYDYLDIKL